MRNHSITITASALVCAVAPVVIALTAGAATPPPAGIAAAPAAHAAADREAPARGGPAGGAGTRGDAAVTHKLGAREQEAATRYWTPDRMRAVLRDAWANGDTMGTGLRWVHAGTVARTTGKVFFTLNGTDYVCSGSVVSGPAGHDVVLTAAHCVGDWARGWATNWTFVPGYTDGTQPYGAYTARQFFVSPRWAAVADDATGRSAGGPAGASAGGSVGGSAHDSVATERYDVAFVTVNPSGGRPLGAVTGGQPAAFGTRADALTGNGADTNVFGYPSEPPFSGMYANYCAGPVRPTADYSALSMRCAMTAGDSGGPWLAGFSPRTGAGTIVAVTTYKFNGDASPLYGTMLGPDAQRLYDQAVSSSEAVSTAQPAGASPADATPGR